MGFYYINYLSIVLVYIYKDLCKECTALDILSEFNFSCGHILMFSFTAAFHILLDHFLRHSKRKPEINHVLMGPDSFLA